MDTRDGLTNEHMNQRNGGIGAAQVVAGLKSLKGNRLDSRQLTSFEQTGGNDPYRTEELASRHLT